MGTFRGGLNFADLEFWDVHVATDNYREKCCKMIAVVLISRKYVDREHSEIKTTANISPFTVIQLHDPKLANVSLTHILTLYISDSINIATGILH